MSDTPADATADATADVNYRRALLRAIPMILFLFAFSVLGYYYAPSSLWIAVFVFGSLAVLVNRIFYQKTLDLRDRIQRP